MFLPSTRTTSAVASTLMPIGVAAMWRTSSRVPRLWWPAGSRCSTAASAAASMRLIITGVASTCTLPLPMRGAVCSAPTTSPASPVRPGLTRASSMSGYDCHMNPRVVIVGCGFGGLWAAQGLRNASLELTVIDRTNHHLFTPLLYQVATAGLSAPAIAGPIRHILAEQRNTTVLLGEVEDIQVNEKQIVLEDGGRIAYDYLVVATGTTNSYFGNEAWASFAPALKTLEDALEIRARILLAFEHAERETDASRRAAWLTFVVIGAGATGVELAGTLAEIARHTLHGEFRRFDSRNARVVLVEGTDRVLPPYPPDLSEKARLQLERLGVTVWLGKRVTAVDAGGVSLGNDRIEARTV